MTGFRLIAAAAVILSLHSAAQAGAPEPACQPYTAARAQLGIEGEKVLWSGRTDTDTDIVVLVQPDGHTFTILEKQDRDNPNGEACLIFRGTTNKLAPAFQPTPAAAPVQGGFVIPSAT